MRKDGNLITENSIGTVGVGGWWGGGGGGGDSRDEHTSTGSCSYC